MSARAGSGSLVRPGIPCAKPAVSGSPCWSTSTYVLSWKTGSSVNSAASSSHQAPCSGRSLFALASSSEEKRASATRVPSSVTPDVEPSQPVAPGPSSDGHLSRTARTLPASETLPWNTWTNIAVSLQQDAEHVLRSSSTLLHRRCASTPDYPAGAAAPRAELLNRRCAPPPAAPAGAASRRGWWRPDVGRRATDHVQAQSLQDRPAV